MMTAMDPVVSRSDVLIALAARYICFVLALRFF